MYLDIISPQNKLFRKKTKSILKCSGCQILQGPIGLKQCSFSITEILLVFNHNVNEF